MPLSTVRRLLLPVLAAALPQWAAAQAAPPATQPPHLRELETKYFSYASESLAHAVEERLLLPPGYPEDLDYVVRLEVEVSETGQAENPRIVPMDEGVSAEVARALAAAVRQLPQLEPARRAGQPVRAVLVLPVRTGLAAAAANRQAEQQAAAQADSVEARTLRRGLAERRPAEAVADFLGRVLPVSFVVNDKPISYAWHPSAYGPQLFFSAPGHAGPMAEYERYLFILDPIGPTSYAVQSFGINQADYTTLEALFFADANRDGQKDLLALTQCDLREYVKINGQLMPGRFAHYQTTVLYYRGRDAAGRPRYEQQYRDDLDGLATADEVRAALAVPPRRSKNPPRRNPTRKKANYTRHEVSCESRVDKVLNLRNEGEPDRR